MAAALASRSLVRVAGVWRLQIPTDVEGRARNISEAVMILSSVEITSQEYWKVFGTGSIREQDAHEERVLNTHAKLIDLLRH